MAGYLTTHVLDMGRGCPAQGLAIDLYHIESDGRHHLHSRVTNADGRTDGPILPETDFATGTYELVFHAGAYLKSTGQPTDFLDMVPIRFAMSEHNHYHVPLLLAPYGFSTYRGS